MVPVFAKLVVAVLAVAVPPLAAPVPGPVVARFDAVGPYSPGHRGIDLGSAAGTVVRAPVAGTVTYVGTVAGNLTISIDAGNGVVVHLSYLASTAVAAGASVHAGDAVGLSGPGHRTAGAAPALHLGLEVDGAYIDPLPYLRRRRAVLVR
ncbi:MAG: M23 family metallopeptidase [Acidimicrobiia bacterium]